MEFLEIGRFRRVHGLEGELKVQVKEEFLEDILNVDFIFADHNGQKLPYFIEEIKGNTDFILRLDGVTTKEDAVLLAGKSIFLRPDDIEDLDERDLPIIEQYKYLIGFELWDNDLGQIGQITDLQEMPFQIMALVNYQNQTVLVPVNQQLILKIDKENKTLTMDLPAGILEL